MNYRRRSILTVIIICSLFKFLSAETSTIIPRVTMPEYGIIINYKLGTSERQMSDLKEVVARNTEVDYFYVYYFFSLHCSKCLPELKRLYAIQKKFHNVKLVPVILSTDDDKVFRDESRRFFNKADAQDVEWVIRDNENIFIRKFYSNAGRLGSNHQIYRESPHFFIYYGKRGSFRLQDKFSFSPAAKVRKPDDIINDFEKMLSENYESK